MRKIIFLDIDGVLNSQEWYDYFFDLELFKDSKYDHDLSPILINKLNKIYDKIPSVQIVISSTWRFDYRDTVDRLVAQGLKIPVIGGTTLDPKYLDIECMPRGVLVAKWLRDYIGYKTCNYVIFDDDQDFLIEQQNNLIVTDQMSGLTEKDVARAIAILGPDKDDIGNLIEKADKMIEEEERLLKSFNKPNLTDK